MQQNEERCLELCRQAAVEMHAGKLLRLVHEINELFRAKRELHTNVQNPRK
jgi:hypothetical protein